MRSTHSLALSLLLLLITLLSLCDGLSFVSNALGSNMVLQRAPNHAHIWGWSKTPNSEISLKFNNKLYTENSSATDGAWSIFLDPTAAGGPYTISITSSVQESAELQNVLFGDVFVCSGQSNMEFTVSSVFNASDEIRDAANYPNIRVFTVGEKTSSATPLQEFATIFQPWAVASPKSIGVANWSAFSAACWFFGRNLYDNLKVPIGLFSDNWGGTPVQAWSSPDALKKCKTSEDEVQLLQVGDEVQVTGPSDPSSLWNAMIVPVLPMSIKGAIWYQGEANAGNPNYYACAFPAMIADWRLKWGGNTGKVFGFYYVQLAPWLNSNLNAEALTRLSQMYANKLPNVWFATAADLGDPTSPFGSIHPRKKQPVGYRLSLAARAISYGQAVEYMSPIAGRWELIGVNNNVATVEVVFSDSTVGKNGLQIVPTECETGVPAAQCSEYEIGTSTGWVAAKAVLKDRATISVSGTVGNSKVTGVRYGFANYPIMSLWSSSGLPAAPFAFPDPIVPSVFEDGNQ